VFHDSLELGGKESLYGEFGTILTPRFGEREQRNVPGYKGICQMSIMKGEKSAAAKGKNGSCLTVDDRSMILTFIDFEFRVNSTILLLDLEFEVELVWSSWFS